MATTSLGTARPTPQRERLELRRDVALTILTGLGLVAGVIAQLLGAPPLYAALAFFVAYLAGGIPTGLEAVCSLARGRLDIDLLMITAALAAAFVGEARDGAILLFLFTLAGTLEAYAMGRTRRAVERLMALRPEVATRRLDNGRSEEVAIDALELGDIVIVKPGERIPIDGTVVSGQSAVDQAAITGESTPRDKVPGDEVFAATVNGHGVLEVRVDKLASETTLARMIALVTEAQTQRSPSQRISDWFGQRYTAFVLFGSGAALASFLLLGQETGDAMYRAATLLVAASPCAVVISVPAAILSALAAAARGGVLFKGGGALEDFSGASIVAFDKTGTLTEGKPAVTDVVTASIGEDELLSLAAGLERHSEHPIAHSIVSAANDRGLEPTPLSEVAAVPGHGLVARAGDGELWAGNRKLAERQSVRIDAEVNAHLTELESAGKTLVLVGEGKTLLGVLAVADRVRPEAKRALERLRQAGMTRLVMLTGDHAGAARSIGMQLGLAPEEIYADLLPEDKVRLVHELRDQGSVIYVGDGINDAAALASAHVGVAMGAAGSDVALEAADVVLLASDLGRLEHALQLAKRASRVVKQNLTFAVGAMIVLVALTLTADLPLPLAVVGHEGGTLLVVANGLRLLGHGRKAKRV
jgi:heavy metal translocating P-type ATPase